MKPSRWPLAPVLLMALLAGCGVLKGGPDPERIYVLNAAPQATTGQPVAGVLSVPRPLMNPGLDTDRIALVRPGNELDYYAASRFGESLPRVVTALALQALGGPDGFTTTVSTDRAGLRSNYELLLTARRFEAAYETGVALPTAQVAFDCLLVTGAPRKVLGRCDATATEPVAVERMAEIVKALETATQRALEQVREKAVAVARANPITP